MAFFEFPPFGFCVVAGIRDKRVDAPPIADGNRQSVKSYFVRQGIGKKSPNGGIVSRQLLPVKWQDGFASKRDNWVNQNILFEKIARLPLKRIGYRAGKQASIRTFV